MRSVTQKILDSSSILVVGTDLGMDKVIDVQRNSDRITCILTKLVTLGKNCNIISAHSPQQGCYQEEKTPFWNQLEEVTRKVSGREELIVAGDLNGHGEQERFGYQSGMMRVRAFWILQGCMIW